MLNRLPSQDGHARLDRRAVLRWGALGWGGLTLDHFLRLRPLQASRQEARKSAILFWMAGGPSHIDMYDMKPEAPAEVRGPFRPIKTNLPGLLVNEHMPRHARIADKLSIIRSISHSHAVHDDGSHWMQTGYPQFNARASGQQYPCEGSVVSYLRGARQPGMPAYVCIPEDYQTHLGFFQSAAYLGKRHDALNAGRDPNNRQYHGPGFTLPDDVTVERLDDRQGLLRQFDRYRQQIETSSALRDADEVQRQAFDLIGSQQARDAFDIAQESATMHELYGRHAWGQAALLARRLVEAGVTFVTINLYEKDVDWWDDHYTIEPNLIKRLPRYDQALSGLIEDLHQRGMSDQVLVAAYGEFGRTPRIDSHAGRGHWPQAMSVVLSGGGLKTGQIVGSTTRDGATPHERPPGARRSTRHDLSHTGRRLSADHSRSTWPWHPAGTPRAAHSRTDRLSRAVRLSRAEHHAMMS